tara:strand:- start:42 stop:1130 length:1089 start_codon:yes stop_codon:yes gene_type:complete
MQNATIEVALAAANATLATRPMLATSARAPIAHLMARSVGDSHAVWLPLVLTLVFVYFVTMGCVLGSFYCWRSSQSAAERAPIKPQSTMPTARPAVAVGRPVDSYYSSYDDPWGSPWRGASSYVMPARPIVTAVQRREFIRKVYSILCSQLLLTVVVVVACIAAAFQKGDPDTTTAFGDWIMRSWWFLLVLLIPILVLTCVLFAVKNTYPWNFVVLFAFTLLESIVVGFICVLYYAEGYGEQILIAAALTCFIFLALTIFTMQSTIDFDFCGPFLFAALLLLLLWGSIMSLVFAFTGSSPGWQIALSLIGALIFCGFIIWDTNQICRHLSVDDYVIGAVELYLDILNLFLYLLQCLSLTSNN